MRNRLHGYSPAEVDQLIIRMFFEWSDEAFVARQLGLHAREVEAALERFATQVAILAQAHWQERLLRQLDELVHCCERLSEIEDPPRVSTALRVRLGALRTLFLAAAPTPTPTTITTTVPGDVAARCPPFRRARRFERPPVHAHAPELAGAAG